MEYLLLIVSYLLRAYGAVQEGRDPINTPLIWQSDFSKNILSIVWISLMITGSYFIYTNNGATSLVISLLIYFLVAPMLFGKIIKKLLDHFGF